MYIYNSGGLEKLPFDIRAARVIQYRSLEELVLRIPLELEKLEVERIRGFNRAKKEFWRGFTIKNTRFLIGSADVLHPQDPHPTDRVSTLDFKGFNRTTYLLLFSGGRRRPYQYEMRIVELAEFIKHKDDKFLKPYLEGPNNLTNWRDNPRDFSIVIDESNFSKLGFNRSGEVMNYVIISSSCINAATEMVMLLLYGKDVPDYLFLDTRPYKARSSFWKIISSDFCEEEFKSPLTIEGLCGKIKNDYPDISLKSDINTIDWLNELLSIPDFYVKVHEKEPNLEFPENIKKLVEKTKDCRKKNFSELNENEKANIKRLNRLLLEETYKDTTPKSCIGIYLSKKVIDTLPDSTEEEKKLKNILEKLERWTENKKEYRQIGKLYTEKPHEDSGLLIILKDPKIFEEKGPQIFKDIKDQEIFKNIEVKGEIILLCGHGAFGTYELCRMISNVINNDEDPEDKIVLPAYNSKEVGINDFFSVVNEIRKDNKPYCIEAVFNFKNEIDFYVHSKTMKELVTFFNFDRKTGGRKSLLGDLVEKSGAVKVFWFDTALQIINVKKIKSIIDFANRMSSLLRNYHQTKNIEDLNSFLKGVEEEPLSSLAHFSGKVRIIQKNWSKADTQFYANSIQKQKDYLLKELSSLIEQEHIDAESKKRIYDTLGPMLITRDPIKLITTKIYGLLYDLIRIATEISKECGKSVEETEKHLENIFIQKFSEAANEDVDIKAIKDAGRKYMECSEYELVYELERMDFNWEQIDKVLKIILGRLVAIAGILCIGHGVITGNVEVFKVGLYAVIIGINLEQGQIIVDKIIESLSRFLP